MRQALLAIVVSWLAAGACAAPTGDASERASACTPAPARETSEQAVARIERAAEAYAGLERSIYVGRISRIEPNDHGTIWITKEQVLKGQDVPSVVRLPDPHFIQVTCSSELPATRLHTQLLVIYGDGTPSHEKTGITHIFVYDDPIAQAVVRALR